MEQDIDNAFATLGLSPDATEPEVKAAWRRLVSRWHPDRNASATAVLKMQQINRAVEAIRQAGFARPGSAADADAAPHADEPDDGAAADRNAAEAPPRTIDRRVRLTLEEAALGCTKVLRGKVAQTCATCTGAGHLVLGGHCPQCHGSGAIRKRAWFGWIGTEAECDACLGGGIARQPCAACAGTGKSASLRYQVTVRFPQGVRHGDLLGVQGHRGKPGSPPADLSIRVEVQPHELLQLDPDGTLRCEMPVDGFTWIANRCIEVPTLDGLQTLELQRQQLSYRLPGRGFPVERRGPRGDQLITLTPVFPQRMSTDQQILLDQLLATTSGPGARQPNEPLRSWDQALRRWQQGGRGRGRRT